MSAGRLQLESGHHLDAVRIAKRIEGEPVLHRIAVHHECGQRRHPQAELDLLGVARSIQRVREIEAEKALPLFEIVMGPAAGEDDRCPGAEGHRRADGSGIGAQARARVDLISRPLSRVRVRAADERRDPGLLPFPPQLIVRVPGALVVVGAEVEILRGYLSGDPRWAGVHEEVHGGTDGRRRVLLGIGLFIEDVGIHADVADHD